MSDPNVVETTTVSNSEPISEPWTESGKSFEQVAREVYDGKWGPDGEQLRQRLCDAGFDQWEVREAANRLQLEQQ